MADLVTLAQVKIRCNVDATDVTDDTLLNELIHQVSEWIQEYTGRTLTPVNAATYVLDTSAGSVIDFPRGVRAVSALDVAASDQPDTGGTYPTSIAAADILLRPSSAYRKPGWPATQILIRGSTGRLVQALNGARATLDEGFAATPQAIQGVALDAIANAYATRQGPTDQGIGEGDTPLFPWAQYFGRGSPQRAQLDRYRAGSAMGIA